MAESIIYVPIAPSMRGFSAPIVREGTRAAQMASRQMTSTFETGGANAGRAGGRGISNGLMSANGSIDSVNGHMARLPAQMGSAGQQAGSQAAAGINSGLASVDYQGTGTSIGSRVGGGLVTALKGTLKAGGIAAAIFGGAALKSGLDRLTTIEDATNSLKTIMGDAVKAGELMGEIKKTVQGTPFNLDQFAEAGKNLVAMNVPAAKVPGYLTAIGEAAAASGKGAEGVQMLTDTFGKMAAQGQVSLDQVWSISNSGVPALQILANHFGTTTDGMKDMISKGAVPAGEAMDALTKGVMEGSDGMAGATRSYAGTMEGLRQTFTGAFGGMKAAIARFGAAFLGPWMPLITKTFGGVTSGLDSVAPKVEAFSAKMANSQGIKNFADSLKNLPATFTRVKDGLSGIISILKDGDFQGAKMTFGLDEDSKFVDILFRIREGVTGLTSAMRDGKPMMDTFKSAAEGGGQAGGTALEKFGSAIAGIGGGTLAVLTESTNALGRAMGFLADHSELVVPVILALAAAYAVGQTAQTGYQIAMIARTPAMYAQVAATWAQSSAMAAHTAALNANTVAMGGALPVENASLLTRIRRTIVDGASTAATWLGVTAIRAHTFATSGNVIATLKKTATDIASTVAAKAARAAVLAWTAAQWLFNAALNANPIGLIVIAIAALVAGFVIAYKNSETFRNIVQSVWEWVQKAASAIGGALVKAFNWVKDAIAPVLGFIQKYWQYLLFALGPMGILIGVIVQIVKHFDLVKSVFSTVWGVVGPILSGFMTAVKILGAIVATIILGTVLIAWNLLKVGIQLAWVVIQPIFGLFMSVLSALGTAAMWLWTNAIMPAFNGIKAVIGLWWTGVQIYFNAFKSFITGVIVPAVMWLWQSVITPAFNAIGMVISFVWNSIIKPAFDALKLALSLIGTAFQWVWMSVIQPVWNALGAGISFVWNSIIKPSWDALTAALRAVGDFFSWVWNSIIKPAWDGLGAGISAVVNNVVKPAFEGIKTALQTVGNFFGTIVEGIKSAWDKLKGYVATPINAVIETVWNNGLKNAWNTIVGFLPGLKPMGDLAPVKFAEGGDVRGPGSRTSDSVLARLSAGEHVWDGMDVIRAGGQKVMYGMRALIEQGIPFTWNAAKGLASMPAETVRSIASAPRGADIKGAFPPGSFPGFKDGGEVEPAWVGQLYNGHLAAKSRNGNPYTWGNEDCSGYMSMIADAIINGGNGVRRWATSSFPGGQPWVPGLGHGFSVGVHDDPGGAGGGHTAGTLSGAREFSSVNVESGGAHGNVAYGGPAAGADDAQWNGVKPGQFHLGIGADGAFESAGGPSMAEQGNVIKKKIKEMLDKALDPIKDGMAATIGSPPPELLGLPPKALTQTKDAAVDAAFAVVGSLGDALRATYDKAKDISSTLTSVVSNPIKAIGGLVRDTGGYLPKGQSIVRNETGRPEAVLNWKQLEEVRKLMEATAQAAGKGFLDDTLDFFGFKKLFDAVSGAMKPADQTGTEATTPNAADITQAQQPETSTVATTDPATTTGTYTEPTYGTGATMQSVEVPLETKMPDVNDATTPGSGDVKAQVKEAFKPHGWDTGAQWDAADWIIGKESGWNPTARNPSSGAFGLFQFLGSTKDQYLPDENPNPKIQGVAGGKYIQDRYGDPLAAKAFWEGHNWYDSGGWLMPGLTMAANATGRPEAVLTASQWSYFDDLLESLPSASSFQAVADVPATFRSMVPRDDEEQASGRSSGGPLVYIENQYSYDPDENAQKTGREVRRAARSDALAGGW